MEIEFSYGSEQILRMLEKVDLLDRKDGTKRRDAYVSEWYFENTLIRCLSYPESKISTGWLYLDDREKCIRHWVKIIDRSSDSDSQFSTDVEVLNALHHTVRKDKCTRHLFHKFSYKKNTIRIMTLKKENGTWTTTQPDKHLVGKLKVADLKEALQRLAKPGTQHGNFGQTWLDKMNEAHLRRLLLQRLFMNFALPGALDVDAVELSDGRLTFHEFKRKTLCPQGHFPAENVTSSFLSGVLKTCRAQGKLSSPKQLFDFLPKRFPVNRANEARVFGLDLSHFRMLEFCHRLGIVYRYSIWNSSHHLAGYRDSPSIEDLFDPVTMRPRNGCCLVSGKHVPKDCTGFVFTAWGKSGSFRPDALRIQATFGEERFPEIHMLSR